MQVFSRLISLAILAMFALPAWAEICDIDSDGDVDRLDIMLIIDGRDEIPDSGDPRDADGDGVITVRDGRTCIARCSLPRCGILTPDGSLIWDQGNWDEENWQ